MIAIVANVLNSDVFKSEGSKSSTNSLRLDFSSREKLLLTAFNSIAELGLEYLFFSSLIASFMELISELVISERSFQIADLTGNILGVLIAYIIVLIYKFWRR